MAASWTKLRSNFGNARYRCALLGLCTAALLHIQAVVFAEEGQEQRESKRPVVANSVGMTFTRIPAGEFQQGSPADEPGRRDDEHRHRVRIGRDFYLGVHEVTQEQFQRVMGRNPSLFQAAAAFRERVAGQDTAQFPVDSVNWLEAAEFCRKLSELPEEKAARRVYRLPTEAEWEYACRAGSDSLWCFGTELAELEKFAWYGRGLAQNCTHRVGTKRPNAWGVFDMHGNVWEWCADWHDADYYKTSPLADPTGPREGKSRVIRGGSWFSLAANCRSAERRGDPPIVGDPDTGFRVVMEQKAASGD